MTLVEFESQIARLKNTFGEKNFPSEKGVIYFSYVEGCSFKSLDRQVSQWIADLKISDPPRGEHFREFARRDSATSFRARDISESSKEPNCKECCDQGVRLFKIAEAYLAEAVKNNEPITYGIPCDCVKPYTIPDRIRVKYENVSRWIKPTYSGKTWEEFSKTREGSEVMT